MVSMAKLLHAGYGVASPALCMHGQSKKSPPWINREIYLMELGRERTYFVLQNLLSSGRPSDRTKYNRKRNHVFDMIRESKKTYLTLGPLWIAKSAYIILLQYSGVARSGPSRARPDWSCQRY